MHMHMCMHMYMCMHMHMPMPMHMHKNQSSVDKDTLCGLHTPVVSSVYRYVYPMVALCTRVHRCGTCGVMHCVLKTHSTAGCGLWTALWTAL